MKSKFSGLNINLKQTDFRNKTEISVYIKNNTYRQH